MSINTIARATETQLQMYVHMYSQRMYILLLLAKANVFE